MVNANNLSTVSLNESDSRSLIINFGMESGCFESVSSSLIERLKLDSAIDLFVNELDLFVIDTEHVHGIVGQAQILRSSVIF